MRLFLFELGGKESSSVKRLSGVRFKGGGLGFGNFEKAFSKRSEVLPLPIFSY